MTKELTLRQAGGSVSATLPKDMADRLRLEAGDRVLAVETDRGILLTPYDPEAERALKVAAKAANNAPQTATCQAHIRLRKKVPGTFCRNGPQGASHKRFLAPFPANDI